LPNAKTCAMGLIAYKIAAQRRRLAATAGRPQRRGRRTQPRRYAFDWNKQFGISSLDPENAPANTTDEPCGRHSTKEGRFWLNVGPQALPDADQITMRIWPDWKTC